MNYKDKVMIKPKDIFLFFLTVIPLLEILLILFDDRGLQIWRRKIHLDMIHEEEGVKFGAFMKSDAFDKILGWDDPAEVPSSETKYIAQSYGDSFTLTVSGESWQKQFLKLNGQGIINLGSQGYGLDQAVLKHQKVSSNYNDIYNTKYSILGINGEMYRKTLNYYAPNYFTTMQEAWFVFKPIYTKSNNSFKLILPPCDDKICLINGLKDINSDIYNNIKNYDYWFNHEIKKPELKFPRLLSYTIALPKIIELKMQRKYRAPYYFINNHSIDLAKYLILNFCETSYNQNITPIILLMYSKYELVGIMKNKREDEWLLKYFRLNNIRYVDTSLQFLKYIEEGGDIDDLFGSDSLHFSIKGDSLVSTALIQAF